MSDKPLIVRLQVKEGRRLAVIGAPAGIDESMDAARAPLGEADVILLFVHDRAGLDAALAAALPCLTPKAILWLAYPKLTSELAGDLSRDVIRVAVPAHRLDTVSQIAVDRDWSALRLKRVR